jgi:hypothetical protein
MPQSSPPNAPRRPYRRPRLAAFGDVRELTLTSLTQNMNDPSNNIQSMT